MMPKNQKDAPGYYGMHLKGVMPFEEFTPSARLFLETVNGLTQQDISILDAAGGNGKRFANGLVYLSTKPNRTISYTITDVMPEALSEFQKDVAPRLPKNITIHPIRADLSKSWKFQDASFDALMMTWALHWLGEHHRFAVKEMVRVMKPKAVGLISTLSPYDVLFTHEVFPQTVSIDELRKMHPEADEIVSDVSKTIPTWIVKLNTDISERLKQNSDFVVIQKHPLSIIGKKQVVGFQPEYLFRVLSEEGCEIILQDQVKNTNFPNDYTNSPKEKTYLYYVFRKR